MTYRKVSSFQVLQRNFTTNTATVQKANGTVLTLGTGGPYTIDDAHSVYVGDIWFMLGQSNMRGHGFYEDLVTGERRTCTPVPSIHLFQSNETWAVATDPTHRLIDSPRKVHHRIPDPTVRDPSILQVRGASLGLPFAIAYQKLNNNVPVGLVACAHGGTSLAQWMEEEDDDDDAKQNTLFGAYRARAEIVGDRCAGILWCQGETDACSAREIYERYGDRFETFLNTLKNEKPAVAIVQIGRHVAEDTSDQAWEAGLGWDAVRLANANAAAAHVAVVSSIDCELDDGIHLSARGLSVVGERLAKAATLAILGRGVEASPVMESAVYEEMKRGSVVVRSIKVAFRHVHQGWDPTIESVQGFSITDFCGLVEFRAILSARIENYNTVRILLTNDIERAKCRPFGGCIRVYYGRGKNPTCNLRTRDGMAPLAHYFDTQIKNTWS